MNWLQSLIYGLVSGVSEFMPISTYGHQGLLRKLFGVSLRDPLIDFMVRIGLLVAVFVSCRTILMGYSRELAGKKRRRGGFTNTNRKYDLRFLFTASVALMAVLIFNSSTRYIENNSMLLCLFFAINGIVLYIVDHLRHGNKDSSSMSGFDAILAGFMGGLSIFPGISRLGMLLSTTVGRGADKSSAYTWALLLSIPALLLLGFFDIIALFITAGFAVTLYGFLCAVVAAIGAFIGGFLIIMLMRLMIVNTGLSGYACYSWGVAMLIFILYLIA